MLYGQVEVFGIETDVKLPILLGDYYDPLCNGRQDVLLNEIVQSFLKSLSPWGMLYWDCFWVKTDIILSFKTAYSFTKDIWLLARVSMVHGLLVSRVNTFE